MRTRAGAISLLLALAGCATPPGLSHPGSITLRLASGTPSFTIGPVRHLEAAARGWHASDVFQYDLELQAYDDADQAFHPLATPRVVTLPQQPAPATSTTFDGLAMGSKYEVVVTARGNVGGTAADQVLNADAPAVAVFDLGAVDPVVSQTIAVPLDAQPFDVTLQLPSNATVPGSVPSWVTSLDATLADPAASGTPLASLTYMPSRTASFAHVRGDHPYVASLTVHSATGRTTSTLPSYEVTRADGVEQVVTPPFALVPPTGTRLTFFTSGSNAYGLDFDAQEHLWVANQNANNVSEFDTTGLALLPAPIAVRTQARGVAVDKSNGDVWVTSTAIFGGGVTRLRGGAIAGTYSTGLYAAGVAVDNTHRAWVANALGNSVTCLDAAGHQAAGSPYGVGDRPAAVAIDAVTQDVFVSNSNGNSISKITAAGVVSGPFPSGVTPGGIAVAPDHTVWVSCNGDGTLRRYHPDGTVAFPPINLGNGPSVMAIDPEGYVWVTLLNGNQAAKLRPDGTTIGTFPVGTFPGGITLDSHGNAWISGLGNVSELAK